MRKKLNLYCLEHIVAIEKYITGYVCSNDIVLCLNCAKNDDKPVKGG
jgi:hypothetical protein